MTKLVATAIATLALAFLLTAGAVFAQVSGAMVPAGGSNVSGNFTLESVDNQTRVTVNLNGLEPGSTHAGHIHLGNCASIGEIQIDLNSITADDNGMGSSTTVVNASLDLLQDGNHLISFHQDPPPNFGATISCGDIPAEAVQPDQLPVAGLGGSR